MYYKYYSLNEKNINTFTPLRDHSIRYTSPEYFNDPYDCKCFFESMDGKRYDSLTKTINDTLRIACFSKTPDSPIMWAHYASDHKGYQIEYDIETLVHEKVEYEDLKPCFYSAKEIKEKVQTMFPDLDLSRDDIHSYEIKMLEQDEDTYKKLKNAIFTKHHDWMYENEYRFMHLDKTKQGVVDIRINASKIKSITLGYKFNHKKYNFLIKKIIDEVYKGKLKVYKVDFDLYEYKANRKEYKFG